MRVNTAFLHFLLLLILPLVVVWLDLGIFATTLLILLWLLSRWFLTVQRLAKKPQTELVLETISVSHFVEKVRWCLDRLGVPYVERANAGTLGAFFAGRTVPKLWVRTGIVQSAIGNSDEILRYLWGRYAYEFPERSAFLKPTVQSIALEKQLDTYGRDLQIWVYYHGLPQRKFILRAWGADDPTLPIMQRVLIRVLFPVQKVMIMRAFRISDRSAARSAARIDALLKQMDDRLAQSDSLVGGRSYIDYTFAALTALWLRPPQFGNGMADGVRCELDEYPPQMIENINTWSGKFPNVVRFVTGLYADERS